MMRTFEPTWTVGEWENARNRGEAGHSLVLRDGPAFLLTQGVGPSRVTGGESVTLSPRIRFEVIKRDRYTCQYCGKHPPDVLLEVDHILPRAAGGSNELHNLTTACSDCNRGKGARLLEEGTGPAVNDAALAEMQERLRQAKAYMAILSSLESVAEDQVWRVTEAWAKAFHAAIETRPDGTVSYQFTYGGYWPDQHSIKRYLKQLGLETMLEAVDIAAARFNGRVTTDVVRYFFGVCNNKVRNTQPPAPATAQAPDESAFDEGYDRGITVENERIRDLFINHGAHGFATYADLVNALWPED